MRYARREKKFTSLNNYHNILRRECVITETLQSLCNVLFGDYFPRIPRIDTFQCRKKETMRCYYYKYRISYYEDKAQRPVIMCTAILRRSLSFHRPNLPSCTILKISCATHIYLCSQSIRVIVRNILVQMRATPKIVCT